jgi:archaetidylinositol phosphate synthase
VTAAGPYVLALAGLALLLLAVLTAVRPPAPVPGRDGYFDRWSRTHGGYDPRTGGPWVRGWLSVVLVLARPLARRGVQPDVLTFSSLWLAGLVLVLADAGQRWAIAAASVVVLSALFDSLDGCVAVLTDRATRWGYVLDSVVDRASDMLYLLAAVAVGCPPELAVALGFAIFLMEYLRARAGNAGGDDVGRITMAERPTRVILLGAAILCSALDSDLADVLVVAGPALLLAMTVVATVQLGATLRRQLLTLPAYAAGQSGR